MGSDAGQRPSRRSTRCVLWHAPDAGRPDLLLDRLAVREVQVTLCSDPMHAMSALCEGATPDEKSIMILAEPDGLPMASDLVRAVRTYLPAAACWIYAPDDSVPLRAVTGEDIARWSGEAADDGPEPEPVLPPNRPGPVLRLIGGNAPDDDLTVLPVPARSAPEGGNLLTTAELAMLLSDDPIAPPPPSASDSERDG
jgi:hypothetical protein